LFQQQGRPAIESQCLALKIVNAALSRIEFQARRTELIARPFGIEVDPCNGCTLACPGCIHSVETRRFGLFDWPRGVLSPDRYEMFLDRYGPYASNILLCNYGEPLLNPRTPDYIRAAKRYLAQATISTSLSVRQFDADAYVASGLDYMIVSIDGATQPVYERFRRNGDLSLVYENLHWLVEARASANTRFPVIAWQYLAFEHNVHEIPLALEKAESIGINEFRITPPFDVSWDDPEMRPARDVRMRVVPLEPVWPEDYASNWNRFPDEINGAAIQKAFEYAWPSIGAGPLQPAAPVSTCPWLYTNTIMDAGGRLLPCCCAPAKGQDLVFGQIDGNNPTADLFNTPKHLAAREFFRTGERIPGGPHCMNCTWLPAKPDIDPLHLRQYLYAAGEPAAGDWLAAW
jgi:pyruvate-formate lyase-activating enzyme